MSDKDIVEEARAVLAEPEMRPFLFGVTREIFSTLVGEVERLRQENAELKKCDARERNAIDRNCRLHRG